MKEKLDIESSENIIRARRLVVRTTDGDVEPFDSKKIIQSLISETNINKNVANKVMDILLKRIINANIQWLSGPAIREMCCSVLAEIGLLEARKRYTRIGMPLMDYENFIEIGLKENANQYQNPMSIHNWCADRISSEYSLLRLLTEEQSKAHLKGDIHIHMLPYFDLRPFCQEFDLRIILKNGLPPVNWPYSAVSKPAKHPIVAFLHAAKWLGLITGEFSGGLGYDNFTVFLAPYVRGLSEKEIEQLAQCFIFESNQIYASRGGQIPFTSISCVPTIPNNLKNVPAISFEGKSDGIYGDYVDECNMLFKALSKVYYEGDGIGRLFNFPKHEVKLKKEWIDKFEDDYLLISEETAKFGNPYYLNLVADWMPDEVHSQCCRLILTPEGIRKICNDPDLFDWSKSYINLGSLQSVSLNLPRYAYKSNGDDDKFFEILDEYMKLSKEILLNKRKIIKKRLETGLLPLCSRQLDDNSLLLDLRKQSVNIGFVGLNECVLSLTNHELHEDHEAYELGKKILQHMSKKCDEFTLEESFKCSLWEQPAESLKSDELILIYNEDSKTYELTEIADAIINENSNTWGFNRNGHPKIMKINKLIKHQKRETLKIRCQHGSISVTNDHSLFSVDENLNIITISGNDVKIGTSLLMPREIEICENIFPLDLNNCCECIEEDGVQFVKLNNRKAFRFIKKTYELGYILGHYIAEGTMRGITVTCGNDKQEIERVATLVNKIFGLPVCIGSHHKEGYLPVYGLQSRSQLAQNIFNEGIGLKPEYSTSKEIPPFLYNAPIECVKGFLAGYIRGDGSIGDYKEDNSTGRDVYVRISTSSRKLVFGLNFLLKRLGIVARLSTRKFDQNENPNWHDAYELRITGRKNLEILSEFIPEVPSVIGHDTSPAINLNIWIKRLNAELKEIYGTSLRKLVTARSIPFIAAKCSQATFNRNISESALLKTLETLHKFNLITPTVIKLNNLFIKNTLTKVLSIEKEEATDYVYDLSVPENENFIAGLGQIYAHNSTASRFAFLDIKHYPEKALIQGNRETNAVYYTNSDHLRYSADIPLFDRIQKQSEFHPIVQGGVITHIWLGESNPDPEGLWKLTKKIAFNTPTAYWAYTKDFTQCLVCQKFLNGIYTTCPHCGAPSQKLEWWSRITGYYSRISGWNAGKVEEWKSRKRYNFDNIQKNKN